MILPEDKPSLEEVLEHHGIKGMHWGVRKESLRSHTTLSKDERKKANKNYHAFASSVLEKKFGPKATLFRDPITENEYKTLSNKDEIIEKGHTLYRTTEREKEQFRSMTYVTTNRKDADVYNAVLAKTGLLGLGGRSYKPTYETTLSSLENLKSPSEKTRLDAFVNLMDTPSITLKNGKVVTGREILRNSEEFKKDAKRLDAHQLGLQSYNTFLKDQYLDTPLNTAYYKSIRDKGYNALIDDNDQGHLANQPLIVLNPNGSVKKMETRQLTADEINRIKGSLKPR